MKLSAVMIIVWFRKLENGKFGGAVSVGRLKAEELGVGSIPDWGFQSGTDLMKTV